MERRKWKSSFRRFMRSAAAIVLAACMLPVPVQAAGSTSSDNGDGTFTNPVIYSDGRYGKLRNGCPHSEIRSFRQPSALRKRRHPANRKSLRNIRSKAFYGMDIQERSPLPLAAEPSSARDRYGICVRCLPFISVFGNYIPPYTAVPPKPDCRSGSCPKPPSRRFFLGGGSDL